MQLCRRSLRWRKQPLRARLRLLKLLLRLRQLHAQRRSASDLPVGGSKAASVGGAAAVAAAAGGAVGLAVGSAHGVAAAAAAASVGCIGSNLSGALTTTPWWHRRRLLRALSLAQQQWLLSGLQHPRASVMRLQSGIDVQSV